MSTPIIVKPYNYDVRPNGTVRVLPSRYTHNLYCQGPSRLRVTREWLERRIWTGDLSEQKREIRATWRQRVYRTRGMSFGVTALHQRITQRGTQL